MASMRSPGATTCTTCAMSAFAVPRGVPSTRAGSVCTRSARLRTSRGKVADTRCVRRSAGVFDRIASMSSRKPMSSMRSASSSTTAATWLASIAPRVR